MQLYCNRDSICPYVYVQYVHQRTTTYTKIPLDKAAIIGGLEQVDLPWVITCEEVWRDGGKYYELCDDNKNGIANISSILDGEDRLLQISFFSDTEIDSALPPNEWEKPLF